MNVFPTYRTFLFVARSLSSHNGGTNGNSDWWDTAKAIEIVTAADDTTRMLADTRVAKTIKVKSAKWKC